MLARQAVFGGLAGAAAWAITGLPAASAAGCGAAIAMINLCMLHRRLSAASAHHHASPLYRGAAERFLFTALSFVTALGHLHLPAVPLLAGFACAQFGHLPGLPAEPEPA